MIIWGGGTNDLLTAMMGFEAMQNDLKEWEKTYARLRTSLAQTSWISEGDAQDRGPGAGGPCYQWTRKVGGKTASVALSQEQYQWLKAAISNWREVQGTLKEMQRLSRQVLFEMVPGPPRGKKLGKRVAGFIQAPFRTDPLPDPPSLTLPLGRSIFPPTRSAWE